MSVDDSGLESLKKAAEEITPGDKSEYQFKTRVTGSTLPTGAATESTLQAVLNSVDELEGDLDGVEALLAAGNVSTANIDANTDTLEALITSSNIKLDTVHSDLVDVQTKQNTGNASLASIDNSVDVDLSTRASEATLVSVLAAVDQLEGYTDGVEALITATNTKLDTANSHLTSLDIDIDVALSTRASEATLAAFQSANHTDLLGVQTRQDSTNTKLDTVNSNLVTVQSKQDTQTAQLVAINANTDGLETLATTTNTEIGATSESAAATDTSTSGLNGLLKRINQHLTILEGYTDTLESLITSTNTEIGATNESVAATDTATSGLNGLTKRINQHLTTLEGLVDGLETLVGTTNTEVGGLTETAPATDTASSGLNGRLQRVAQRLTTLIAFYANDYGSSANAIRTASQIGNASGAAAFGAGATSAQTIRTVLATDQTVIPVSQSGAPWSQNLTQVGGAAIALGQALSASSIPVVTQADSMPATQNITTQDIGSSNVAGANAQPFILGTPTVGSAATFSISSFEGVDVQVTGTWTGTVATEVSMDGGTIWSPRGVKQTGSSYIASSFTAVFWGGMNAAAITNVRVRATAAMTGTAIVRIVASTNTASIIVSNPTMLRDGVTQSTLNTIKAASTASIATDTAIVVAVSPNNTPVLPSGAATSANQTTIITALQIIDDLPHAQNAALVKGIAVMGQLDDTGTTAATEDAVAALRITAQRAAHINLRDNAGAEIGITAAPVKVRNSDGTDQQGITTNGDAKTVDGLRNAGVYGALNIPTVNVPVEAKVGGARLANRKFLLITLENNGVFWGLDSSVTTTSGIPTVSGQILTFSIDPDSTFQVWLVGSANNKNVHVVEVP